MMMPANMLHISIDFAAGGLLQPGFWTLAPYPLAVTLPTVFAVTFVPAPPPGSPRPCPLRDRSGSAQPPPQAYRPRGLAGVELYREARAQRDDSAQYGRGTPDDWIERRLSSRHPTLGPMRLLAVSVVLFGPSGLAVGAIQVAWIPFWAAGVVNGLSRWRDDRNFETTDTATNLVPRGVWIGGEELHNSHHAFPSSAKFALRRREFDLGRAVIRAPQCLGLARVLRGAQSLDVRPNVPVPNADTVRALLAHRFQTTTEDQRDAIHRALREEARTAGAKLRARIPRGLRRALAGDGRWIDPDVCGTVGVVPRRRSQWQPFTAGHATRRNGYSLRPART